jgi:nucleotide-binding universal stress UspA family protein
MKHGHNDEPRRIVVGLDGFESSKAALRWAIHQAKLTGAVVGAVTAWQVPVGTGWIPAADTPDYQQDAFTVLAEAIAEMCTVDPGVQVCPRALEGRAGQVLVDAAEGADLLVVGDLQGQQASLQAEEDKLTLASQRLAAKVDAFRTR